ncbi:MAG TPA: cob(I)yrinic acid a,c-diamide adenosyltransferase [Longimicrobiaceae bacterium]|nr:cob(I)yrinic acid a,c-diamide adenosyltransferase [Longimicrobiaceae bacterium]
MKIYTRTGDRGETGLFGGGRVPKDHARVEAYGEVDELNSLLGVVVVALEDAGEGEIAGRLRRIQADLFTLGANLATPRAEEGGRASAHLPELPAERIAEMESWIDAAEEELEPLRSFILPGGSQAAALLHLARTVCRRAERRVVALAHEAQVEEEVIVYLNRLSDLLFTLARLANRRAGMHDIPWVPDARG